MAHGVAQEALRERQQERDVMHVLSIPPIVMASIGFYVGLYYLVFYMKMPQTREYLPFALLCFSVGFYDVFTAGLYNSLTIHEGIFWQRLQLTTIFVLTFFLIWFAGVFTEQKVNRILRFSIAWFIFMLCASLFVSAEFTLTPANPAIKNINLFNILQITYYEGATGIIYQIAMVSYILLFLYLIWLFIRYYQRTKHTTTLMILFCQIIYFLGTANDALVAAQVYSFIYISEYCFFFVVIAMAYTLLDKFVNLHSAFEKLNITLEQKVTERTREIRDAQAKLLQQDKMASIGQLAAGVAHEINNPMGFISSNLRTLDKYVTKLTDFVSTQSKLIEHTESKEVMTRLNETRKASKIDFITDDVKSLIDESLDGAERAQGIWSGPPDPVLPAAA